MLKITEDLLNSVTQKAKESERKRANYNFHKSYAESMQRFLNAVEPNTYAHPHKHTDPDKTEIFLILRGRVLVLEFNDKGEIVDYIILNFESGNKGVEIPPNSWHSIIALEENSVLYEIKGGTFIKETDKVFANWAPEEGTKESKEFINKILRICSLED